MLKILTTSIHESVSSTQGRQAVDLFLLFFSIRLSSYYPTFVQPLHLPFPLFQIRHSIIHLPLPPITIICFPFSRPPSLSLLLDILLISPAKFLATRSCLVPHTFQAQSFLSYLIHFMITSPPIHHVLLYPINRFAFNIPSLFIFPLSSILRATVHPPEIFLLPSISVTIIQPPSATKCLFRSRPLSILSLTSMLL